MLVLQEIRQVYFVLLNRRRIYVDRTFLLFIGESDSGLLFMYEFLLGVVVHSLMHHSMFLSPPLSSFPIKIAF